MRNGGIIKIWTRTGAKQAFRLRVQQIPGEVMNWTGGPPLGLVKRVRTFTLSPQGGMTHLRVREEFSSPLLGLIWNTMPDLGHTFTEFVSAVKARAELIG